GMRGQYVQFRAPKNRPLPFTANFADEYATTTKSEAISQVPHRFAISRTGIITRHDQHDVIDQPGQIRESPQQDIQTLLRMKPRQVEYDPHIVTEPEPFDHA